MSGLGSKCIATIIVIQNLFEIKYVPHFLPKKMYVPLLNVNSKLSLADDLKNNNNNYTAVVN